MKRYNKDIGALGENISLSYLKEQGHIILNNNFKNKLGELDIISKIDDLIIFTEVKSRYTTSYGYPLEAVTYFKQKQIIKLSNMYIQSKKLYNFNIRYDVIEILFNTSNNAYSINHIVDAFRDY